MRKRSWLAARHPQCRMMFWTGSEPAEYRLRATATRLGCAKLRSGRLWTPRGNAQAARAELMAEEILEIADDSSADFVEFETPSGRIRREPNQELVQRSRLRVETRKYLMEK